MTFLGQKIRNFIVLVLFTTLTSGCTVAENYESAPYTVLEKPAENIEIRAYEPAVIAKVEVQGAQGDAANRAFSPLFDYISGNNRSRTEIAMTVPVTQEAVSEKIAMTVPVTQEKTGSESWGVAFYLPRKYTLDNAPIPNNDSVKIEQLEPYRAIAIIFSGRSNDKNFLNHKDKLIDYMTNNDLQPTEDDAIYAYYNSPFTPFFMRRNEVIYRLQ